MKENVIFTSSTNTKHHSFCGRCRLRDFIDKRIKIGGHRLKSILFYQTIAPYFEVHTRSQGTEVSVETFFVSFISEDDALFLIVRHLHGSLKM